MSQWNWLREAELIIFKTNLKGIKMQFIPNTLLGFFDSSHKSYKIPDYQRAYSWEQHHWKALLDDLLEQNEGDNNYFFGNILIEETSKNRQYEIIDGQQRIITIIIFIHNMTTMRGLWSLTFYLYT